MVIEKNRKYRTEDILLRIPQFSLLSGSKSSALTCLSTNDFLPWIFRMWEKSMPPATDDR